METLNGIEITQSGLKKIPLEYRIKIFKELKKLNIKHIEFNRNSDSLMRLNSFVNPNTLYINGDYQIQSLDYYADINLKIEDNTDISSPLIKIGDRSAYDTLRNNIIIEQPDYENLDKTLIKIQELFNKKIHLNDGRIVTTTVKTYIPSDKHKMIMTMYMSNQIKKLNETYHRLYVDEKLKYNNRIRNIEKYTIPDDCSYDLSQKVRIFRTHDEIVYETTNPVSFKIKYFSKQINSLRELKYAPSKINDLVFHGTFQYFPKQTSFKFKSLSQRSEENGHIMFHPHIASDGKVCLGNFIFDRKKSCYSFLKNIEALVETLKTVNLDSIHQWNYMMPYTSMESWKKLEDVKEIINKEWSV